MVSHRIQRPAKVLNRSVNITLARHRRMMETYAFALFKKVSWLTVRFLFSGRPQGPRLGAQRPVRPVRQETQGIPMVF